MPNADCINFICEANFDNKKLGHACRKRRISNTEMKFSDIFFSFFCQKQVKLAPNAYFCCILYLFRESCSLIPIQKIETFISQSQKQNLAFRLDNF